MLKFFTHVTLDKVGSYGYFIKKLQKLQKLKEEYDGLQCLNLGLVCPYEIES